MGGLRQLIPATFLMMFIGTIALTGFPLTAGYYSKDAIIEGAFAASAAPHMFAFVLLVVAAFFTSLQLAFNVHDIFRHSALLERNIEPCA